MSGPFFALILYKRAQVLACKNLVEQASVSQGTSIEAFKPGTLKPSNPQIRKRSGLSDDHNAQAYEPDDFANHSKHSESWAIIKSNRKR